ncbi:hypothetical protein [Cohnella pontilimi]|uniref:hypothetical protein n=1 Tax=Cohnella pontilimi TaxID=2564100 RepID=UPI00145F0F53|nr:hypothetical protein [Cohnella pontilimi]
MISPEMSFFCSSGSGGNSDASDSEAEGDAETSDDEALADADGDAAGDDEPEADGEPELLPDPPQALRTIMSAKIPIRVSTNDFFIDPYTLSQELVSTVDLHSKI